MAWDKILDESYKIDQNNYSRLEWLSECIFDFDTYESEYAELFANKAIDVCIAINNNKTFEFIEDSSNRMWFLIMCNMPFFKERITWGSSIRGSFWDYNMSIYSCGLYFNGEQMTSKITFDEESWVGFINNLVMFSRTKDN